MHALLAVLALALQLTAPVRAAEPDMQDPAALSAVAESYLRAQLAALPGSATITMDPVHAERLPACQSLSPFISTPMRLRSRMSVGVRCAAPQVWTTYVQATVSVAGQYYVAAQPITAGRVIQPEDLVARDADLVTLPADVILDPGLAIGKRASARLAPGQTVRASSLRSAQSVERGRIVTLIIKGSGFTVTSEGEALGSAGPGDPVQVRTTSGQIVSGVLRPTGQVEVAM